MRWCASTPERTSQNTFASSPGAAHSHLERNGVGVGDAFQLHLWSHRKTRLQRQLIVTARSPKSLAGQPRQGRPTKHPWIWNGVRSELSIAYKSSNRA